MNEEAIRINSQEQSSPTMRSMTKPSVRYARLIRAYSMPFVLFVLVAFFSLKSERFFSIDNFLTITNNATVSGILALGMTFVLIVGGIDLSVGSIVTLTTVVLGILLVEGPVKVDIWLAIPAGLLAGCTVGLVNGLLVVRGRVPAIIVTLGTLYIVQSIASYATQGAIISLRRFPELTYIGQEYIGKVQVPVIILGILALVCYVVLNWTTFGVSIRAIGDNRDACTLMGLNVAGHIVAVYMISGLMASIAGLIVAGRLSMASSQAGSELELPAIAAAVLGGTSLFGGQGSMIGTLVGALIMSALFNGLILTGVPFFYQLVATGCVLILAVAFNESIRRFAQ